VFDYSLTKDYRRRPKYQKLMVRLQLFKYVYKTILSLFAV